MEMTGSIARMTCPAAALILHQHMRITLCKLAWHCTIMNPHRISSLHTSAQHLQTTEVRGQKGTRNAQVARGMLLYDAQQCQLVAN